MLKGKNLPPTILYTARLSFRTEGKIKRQAKTKRVHQYKSEHKRNANGLSQSGKEKAATRNKNP